MSRLLFFLLSLFYLIGLLISDHLVLEHVSLKLGNTQDYGLCNLVDFFSCKAAAQSAYSELFGNPIALIGEAYYITALFTLLALRFTPSPQKTEEDNNTSTHLPIQALGIASLLSVLYSIFLGTISLVELEQICPFCFGLYAINFMIFAIYVRTLGKSWMNWIPNFKSLTPWLILIFMGSSLIATQAGYAIRYNQRLELQKKYRAKRPPPTHHQIQLGTAPLRSSKAENPSLLIEFSDFECPFCKRFAKNLKKVYQDPQNRVNYAFKHFPLSSQCNRFLKRDMHPFACEAAKASICAQEQGQFWEMHDLLFENNHALESSNLLQYATQLNLKMDAFTSCLKDPKTTKRLELDIEEAKKLGVKSTPSFYIDGWKFSGAYSVKMLKETLEGYAHRPASAGPIPKPAPSK